MTARRLYRGLAVVVGALALLVAAPVAASAHPLGNFTVNRYSGLVVSTDGVTVDHVLDLAEIPTAQRTPGIDRDRDGTLAPAELRTWSAGQCDLAAKRLRLRVSARRVPLRVTTAAASTSAGQAGLPILRLDCRLRGAATVDRSTTVAFEDAGAGEQVGWREVTARGDGVTLTRADVPVRSASARLTAYPSDLLRSPLDVRRATLSVRPGGPRLTATEEGGPGLATVAGGVNGSFQDLATRYDGSPLVAVTALLAALALGAGHAVAPGHGKTIMAFYLSGRRENALRAAATVGATVTATHTAGVLTLGLLVSAGTAFVPARVYPWLTVLSGVLVVAVGLTLLRAARLGHGHDHPHDHPHGEVHGHTHGGVPGHQHATSPHGPHGPHGAGVEAAAPVAVLLAEPHHHDHAHPHAPRPAAPARRGLVAMGLAGGLVPSPSAVLVLLGAIAVGHPWFGVLLVVAFGLGMATTLAVVGVLVMRLRDRVERRLHAGPGTRVSRVNRALAGLPVVTALTVVALGTLVAVRGAGAVGG